MENLQSERERELWKMAKKRVSFRRHFTSYVIINIFLWAVWFMTGKEYDGTNEINFPWPLWCTLGWGIGIAFSFFDAFLFNKPNAIEREFEKLKGRES